MPDNFHLPWVTLSSPGTVAFYIFSHPVRWYGVLIGIAFLVAYSLAEKLVYKNNLDINRFSDLIFFILISSVVFARLYFVFLSWNYFKDHLDEIPKIWHGGQSIHGGILGAIIATVIYTKIKKISFYNYIDVIAVITPLGQAIGRWGNFFNNEAFGRPVVSSFLKLYIPKEFRPDLYLNNDYFHPTFLYESILDFIIFVFLYRKYSSWKTRPGKVFWTYLLSYSIVRFFLEFLRTDSLYMFGNIPGAQMVSVLIFIVAAMFLLKK
jgi:phosphatidylglycerol:prolipoprotein diacylglycerol transferase